jgi:predicted enzyme related to lactoylglutathione lyase
MGQPVAMFEIISADPQRAKDFYTGLFEWTLQPVEEGYALIDTGAGDSAIGGAIGSSSTEGDTGVKIYVKVDDLPSFIDKAVSLGGTAVVPPTDLPEGYGAFAMVTDPDGNLVGLWA